MDKQHQKGNLTSVIVTFGDRETIVYLRINPIKLMKKYDLSDAMLLYLARSYGGYSIADERTEKALVRRGLSRAVRDEGFTQTARGRSLCEKLFYKVVPVRAAV